MYLFLFAAYVIFDPAVLGAIIFLAARRNSDPEVLPVALISLGISVVSTFAPLLIADRSFTSVLDISVVVIATIVAVLGALVWLLMWFCAMPLKSALAAAAMYGTYRAAMPIALALIAPLPHC